MDGLKPPNTTLILLPDNVVETVNPDIAEFKEVPVIGVEFTNKTVSHVDDVTSFSITLYA